MAFVDRPAANLLEFIRQIKIRFADRQINVFRMLVGDFRTPCGCRKVQVAHSSGQWFEALVACDSQFKTTQPLLQPGQASANNSKRIQVISKTHQENLLKRFEGIGCAHALMLVCTRATCPRNRGLQSLNRAIAFQFEMQCNLPADGTHGIKSRRRIDMFAQPSPHIFNVGRHSKHKCLRRHRRTLAQCCCDYRIAHRCYRCDCPLNRAVKQIAVEGLIALARLTAQQIPPRRWICGAVVARE